MKITYLAHSGFLVETQNYNLIFDYYKGTVPTVNSTKKTIVFVSHNHFDHFNKEIFQLFSKAVFVLSNDITSKHNCVFIGPNETLTLDHLVIETFKSTDEGVAFLLKVDGNTIYHAGDLNLWKWKEETNVYNKKMEVDFTTEIKKIGQQTIDLAFLPLDPRQEEFFSCGFHYFMEHTNTLKAVPMHFGDKYSIIDAFLSLDKTQKYKEKVVQLAALGQTFYYN